MKYNVTLKNKVYEVEVERGEAILINVSDVVAATPVAIPASPAAAPAPAAPAGNLAGEAVNAPMPGTVLQVKVNVGDAVKAGQVLVVMEAMKMEAEIPAPRDGTVAHIVVSKGASVNTGSPLLTLS